MTNEVETKLKSFVSKEEAAGKAWFGTNWVPVGVGIVIGMIVMAVIHHLSPAG